MFIIIFGVSVVSTKIIKISISMNEIYDSYVYEIFSL